MMQRREVLRRVAWMLGGAVSAPAALAILQGCSAKDSVPAPRRSRRNSSRRNRSMDIVTEIADIIIPKTDTSGAQDAGVPAFIDSVLADVYPKDAQERFTTGLGNSQPWQRPAASHSSEQEPAQRVAYVKQSLEQALAGERNPKPFILMARELTLLGFFTSKVGITENMEYVAVPTAYHGCVPLSQMKKHVYWE